MITLQTVAAFILAVLFFMLACKIFGKLVGVCWKVFCFAVKLAVWPAAAVLVLGIVGLL